MNGIDAFHEKLRVCVPQHPEGRLPRRNAKGELIKVPVRVLPVPEARIAGPAFFPGGDGLWQSSSDPRGGVMVVGKIFGCLADFEKSRNRGHEDMGMSTWKRLLCLLEGLIDLNRCFFTNAYPGLLEGRDNDAEFLRPPWYRARCEEFMRWQMAELEPRVVLALGPCAVDMCGRALGLEGWRNQSIAGLDRAGRSLGKDSSKRHFVSLLHPSFWGELRHGKPRSEVERGLLRQAMELVGPI